MDAVLDMANLEVHKGEWCPYRTQFCQEMPCGNCEVYLELKGLKQSELGNVNKERDNGNKQKSD